MGLFLILAVMPLLYSYTKYVVLLSTVSLLFYNFYWKRRNLPPGPVPLPLIGNLYIFANPDTTLAKLVDYTKRYGPIYTFWAGEKPFIFINDYDSMQKYFVKRGDDFSDRKLTKDVLKILRGGEYGVVQTSGERWREQRRFALHTLRDFGMGKNQMEDRILTELDLLIKTIDDRLSQPSNSNKQFHNELDLCALTDLSIGSVINAIICGYRFTIEGRQKQFQSLKLLVNRLVSYLVNPIFDYSLKNPWVLQVWPLNILANNGIATFREILGFMKSQVEVHLQENDYDDDFEPNDFMDVFLLEKARKERNGEDTSEEFNLEELQGICIDLWIAGQETTSSALQWIFAYLIHNQEVQQKLHRELDEIIGSDRLITSLDKSNLNYVNAVVAEGFRCGNLLTFNIPHATTREVEIEGFKVPQGTVVVPQLSTSLVDERYFPNPFSFKPERFIDGSGHFKSIDQFIPFSLGRRQCLGEGMARAEMFLFTANILNKYKLLPGKELPSLKKLHPGTPAHAEYSCRLERRH